MCMHFWLGKKLLSHVACNENGALDGKNRHAIREKMRLSFWHLRFRGVLCFYPSLRPPPTVKAKPYPVMSLNDPLGHCEGLSRKTALSVFGSSFLIIKNFAAFHPLHCWPGRTSPPKSLSRNSKSARRFGFEVETQDWKLRFPRKKQDNIIRWNSVEIAEVLSLKSPAQSPRNFVSQCTTRSAKIRVITLDNCMQFNRIPWASDTGGAIIE